MKIPKYIFHAAAKIILPTFLFCNAAHAHQYAVMKDLRSLIDELTTTPERQQKALDQLSKIDDKKIVFLFNYFEDKRPIANRDVRFLNTSPKAFEKYFMTTAERIDEVVVQFVCIRTKECALGDTLLDVQNTKKQLRIHYKLCFEKKGLIVPCRKSSVR